MYFMLCKTIIITLGIDKFLFLTVGSNAIRLYPINNLLLKIFISVGCYIL